MSEITRPVMNIADVELSENGNGDSFEARIGSFGRMIGSTGIGCMLHEVAPGKKAFPFHNHHSMHEMFYVLEGEGTYRFGEETFPVRAGDVLAAPCGGREVAHQIINTGNTTLRYLGVSTVSSTEVVEYPDSNKFAVMSRFDWNNPDAGGIRFIGREEASLDYWDDET
ncbi:MAG: cupin domain-containing protein [Hyphomicrobiales bacterium]|nr:cupin domain-containing protein [Hyphomicrobiales bacterium]